MRTAVVAKAKPRAVGALGEAHRPAPSHAAPETQGKGSATYPRKDIAAAWVRPMRAESEKGLVFHHNFAYPWPPLSA
jgi:hypothetical protein